MEAGADCGAGWKECDGRSLLDAAAEGGSHEAVSAVLEAGGLEELNTVSGDQDMTALHHAIAGGHVGAARVLMLAGADVGSRDARDRSALHYAAEGGHLKLAEYVIIGGAELNAEDDDGNTPLHLTAAHDDEAFVGTLLRRGASMSAISKKGQNPLHVAVENCHVAVAEALLQEGADPNELYQDRSVMGSALWDLAMTRRQTKHGAEVNLVGGGGFAPPHLAAGFGRGEVVEALVEAGADAETKSSGTLIHSTWGAFKLRNHGSSYRCSFLQPRRNNSALERRGRCQRDRWERPKPASRVVQGC